MEQKNGKILAAGLILTGVALIIILGTTLPVAIGVANTNSPKITIRSSLDQTSSGSVLTNAAPNALGSSSVRLDDYGRTTVHRRRCHGKTCCNKHPHSKYCKG